MGREVGGKSKRRLRKIIIGVDSLVFPSMRNVNELAELDQQVRNKDIGGGMTLEDYIESRSAAVNMKRGYDMGTRGLRVPTESGRLIAHSEMEAAIGRLRGGSAEPRSRPKV